MKNKIVISRSEVKSKKVNHLKDFAHYSHENYFWDQEAGESEYKLYSYLSHKFNNTTILDIGTRWGGSAIAFSDNPNNKVVSFDIVEWSTHEFLSKDNIELRIGDFMQDESIDYSNVSIIMIDVDPHDGLQEPPMLEFLKKKKWAGILLLDDIGDLWPEIKSMWDSLPYEKYDVTDIGHFSGTGILNFGEKYEIEVID